jgi:hypothetical protein
VRLPSMELVQPEVLNWKRNTATTTTSAVGSEGGGGGSVDGTAGEGGAVSSSSGGGGSSNSSSKSCPADTMAAPGSSMLAMPPSRYRHTTFDAQLPVVGKVHLDPGLTVASYCTRYTQVVLGHSVPSSHMGQCSLTLGFRTSPQSTPVDFTLTLST